MTDGQLDARDLPFGHERHGARRSSLAPVFREGDLLSAKEQVHFGAIPRPRNEYGQFTAELDYYSDDVTFEGYFTALDRKWASIEAEMVQRQRARVRRTSKRRADAARREAERTDTCQNCGGPMPEGAYANRRTCSDACRQALSRTRRRASKAYVVTRTGRHAFAARVERHVRQLDPFIDALADYTDEVWAVPMPGDYPDEHEWRMTQAMTLLSLVRDERTAIRPSLVRFRRRAKHYIRRMRRLSKGS